MARDKVNEIYESFTDGIKSSLIGPFQLLSSVEEPFISQGGEGVEEAPASEVFEEGVVYLMGLQGTQLSVGESSIALDPMNIHSIQSASS